MLRGSGAAAAKHCANALPMLCQCHSFVQTCRPMQNLACCHSSMEAHMLAPHVPAAVHTTGVRGHPSGCWSHQRASPLVSSFPSLISTVCSNRRPATRHNRQRPTVYVRLVGALGATSFDMDAPDVLESGGSAAPPGAHAGAPPAQAAAAATAIRTVDTLAGSRALGRHPSIPELHSARRQLQLERMQQAHSQGGIPEQAEYTSLDVAAPGRTLDCGGRQYRRVGRRLIDCAEAPGWSRQAGRQAVAP